MLEGFLLALASVQSEEVMVDSIGYHGTAEENVSGILKEGLRFPEPSLGNGGDTIWVARTLQGAFHSGPAVFEVNFEGLKGGWFEDYGEPWQAHIFEEVPPSRLRLMFMGMWRRFYGCDEGVE